MSSSRRPWSTSSENLPAELFIAGAADVALYEREAWAARSRSLDPAAWRARRGAHGVYEQRADGRFLVRGRVSAGTLHARQAQAAAEAARAVGAGHLHLTTRQDLQIHDVPEERVPEAMRRLLFAGLPTAATGGNTIRNVTVCPLAGVCPREIFDVAQVARRLGHALLAAGSTTLPRKFKISLSGCACDCALAGAADLGLVATARRGRPGFTVLLGGGLGRSCRHGDVAEEFLDVAHVPAAAGAALTVFDRHGERGNRSRARLRFAFDRLGPETVLSAWREARRGVATPWHGELPALRGPGEERGSGGMLDPPWQRPLRAADGGLRYVPQHTAGLAAVPVHPPLGVLSAHELGGLGALAERFGALRRMRLTTAQGLLLLDVPLERLPELAAALARIGPELGKPSNLDHVVACPGSAGCRAGVRDSRAAARRIGEALDAAGIPADALGEGEICVSGCENACGLAPAGAIGLAGLPAGRAGGHGGGFRLTLGASRGSGGWRLGASVGVVSEAEAGTAVLGLVRDFLARRGEGERFGDYTGREGLGLWRARPASAA